MPLIKQQKKEGGHRKLGATFFCQTAQFKKLQLNLITLWL